jgi:hypothetical protein
MQNKYMTEALLQIHINDGISVVETNKEHTLPLELANIENTCTRNKLNIWPWKTKKSLRLKFMSY